MGNIVLPESVKVAKVKRPITSASTLYYDEIPIKPNLDEIALLLGIKWIVYNSGANTVYCLLWKKSAPKTDSLILTSNFYSEDVIDYHLIAVAGVNSDVKQYALPYPLVLLRCPQLVTYASVGSTTGTVTVVCWYVTQKVSKEELARLMVKDHD